MSPAPIETTVARGASVNACRRLIFTQPKTNVFVIPVPGHDSCFVSCGASAFATTGAMTYIVESPVSRIGDAARAAGTAAASKPTHSTRASLIARQGDGSRYGETEPTCRTFSWVR